MQQSQVIIFNVFDELLHEYMPLLGSKFGDISDSFAISIYAIYFIKQRSSNPFKSWQSVNSSPSWVTFSIILIIVGILVVKLDRPISLILIFLIRFFIYTYMLIISSYVQINHHNLKLQAFFFLIKSYTPISLL